MQDVLGGFSLLLVNIQVTLGFSDKKPRAGGTLTAVANAQCTINLQMFVTSVFCFGSGAQCAVLYEIMYLAPATGDGF